MITARTGVKRQNSTSSDPRGAAVVQKSWVLEYNVSIYCMNTEAKSLPAAGCLTFTC